MKKILLFTLTVLFFSLNAQTDLAAIVIPDQKFDLSDKTILKDIQLPKIRKVNGYIPVLRAKIYFENSRPTGWTPCVVLKLNGKAFSEKTEQGHVRLLRRGKFFHYRIKGKNGKSPYFVNGKMYGMIGTGKETDVDKRIISAREEGYRYYFDISDLVKYGQKNILTLGSALTLKAMRGQNKVLHIRDMKIIYVKDSDLPGLRKED